MLQATALKSSKKLQATQKLQFATAANDSVQLLRYWQPLLRLGSSPPLYGPRDPNKRGEFEGETDLAHVHYVILIGQVLFLVDLLNKLN